MYKSLLLFGFITLLSSCALLKKAQNETVTIIEQHKLDSIIEESITELIKCSWLSDYLIQNNERPILISSKIKNNTKAIIDLLKVYDSIDLNLIKTGQVRVLKSDKNQQLLKPSELAKGQSIDFVLSATFDKNVQISTSNIIFKLSLWDEKTADPILTIIKEIK